MYKMGKDMEIAIIIFIWSLKIRLAQMVLMYSTGSYGFNVLDWVLWSLSIRSTRVMLDILIIHSTKRKMAEVRNGLAKSVTITYCK